MPPSTPEHRTDPPVAIVGIGCLFPRSPDLSAYWANILAAADCISDVPEGHSWSVDDFYDADPSAKDRTWCTKGGFLDRIPFDPMAFGIPPTHLESIDTTQLLSLVVAREALRDAGVDPDGAGWDRDRVACILGITGTQELAVSLGSRLNGHHWRRALKRCGVDERVADAVVQDIANHLPTWTEQSFPGLLGNVVAGRIANRLDLGGTNCVVDAACASSLAAMQYAIGDLVAGRSDLVLTGGADTLNDAFMYQCFTRTPAFSKSDDARPFDASADGILIGEGIAIVALKRLEDAERDGDRVYAVIKGLGSSSDGRHKSIYAPNPAGQAKALRRTYQRAGVTPDTIELVEAHGTGTKAGDAAEIQGLRQAFGEAGGRRWCALGSVKSQIGHTKSTAGAAGLVKAALALHQRVLPPTARIDQPNPKMGWDDGPFYLSPRARPWIRAADHPRRAAVSAFGFGGSNYHAVLEEHGDSRAAAPMSRAETELFLLRAESAAALDAQLAALEAPSDAPTFAHRAREVQRRWAAQPVADGASVAAFTARDEDELRRRAGDARRALKGQTVPGVHVGRDLSPPKVAFLFPGQGSQYLEMGRTLALRHPVVRAALDEADEALRQAGVQPLSQTVFPPPAFDAATQAAQEAELTSTERAQPAIGALSRGMAELLATFGVRPTAVAGHSYGELVALHVAGVFDTDAFFTASLVRGQAMAGQGDRGTMAAVSAPLERIEAALASLDGVVLANRNHPEQGVISGSRQAVEAAIAALAAQGIEAKRLSVSAAFHSPLVADAAGPLGQALDTLSLHPPALPVLANATNAPYPDDAGAQRDLLVRQITSPVDFVGIVAALRELGAEVLVEVGPKGVLRGLARRCAPDLPVVALDGRGHRGDDGDTQLKEALAALAALGVPVDVSPLLAERLPLPPRLPGSAATVWLAGANHRNPETLDPPMPELPRPVAPVRPAEPEQTSASWLDIPSSGAPMQRPPALERSAETAPASQPQAPPPVSPPHPTQATDGQGLAALLASTRETLAAFQRSQERAAEVHGRFLDAWSRSSESFTTLFQTHARLVELAATGEAGPLPELQLSTAQATVPASAPLPEAPRPAPAPAPQAAPFEPEAPAASGDEGFGRVDPISTATTAISDDLPPIFDAMAAVQGRQTTAAPPPAAPTGPSLGQLQEAVLAAVADKTGYPTDLVEPSMDLESDLGVDSIKRVEILSAVSDRVPGLPDLDNDRMAALRTLQEVIDYLAEVAGSGAIAPTQAPAAPAGPSLAQLQEAVLAAVADKTGYPTDLVEPSMDLESDLGVDSIKRVEILSAVSDRVPGLPDLDNDRMGALRTLQEVIDYLAEVAGTAGGEPQVLSAGQAGGVPSGELFPPRPAGLSTDEVVEALVASVAEKTGYPRDLIELSMDLESDLGVDSIKRVEILSAVSDRLPQLPELDNDAMSRLRTLSEVVEYLAGVGAGLGFALIGGGGDQQGPVLLVPPEAPAAAAQGEPPPPPVSVAVDLVDPTTTTLTRREVRIQPAPPASGRVDLEGPVVVTADRGTLAAELTEALRQRGVDARLADPADWSDAVAVAEAMGDAVGLVHLAALGADGDDLRARVRGAFLAARAIGPRCRLLVTASQLGGRFGQDRGLQARPLQGALAGLVKTAAQEWPQVHAVALDLCEAIAADDVADAILARRAASFLTAAPGALELGLTPAPVVLRTLLAPLPDTEATAPLTSEDLVVVSGGARGVTAAVVLEMARRWQPRLLLLGRSALMEEPRWAAGVADDQLTRACADHARAQGERPSPRELSSQVRRVLANREVRQTLEALARLGSEVQYEAVDVRDAAAVAGAIGGRPVAAVVHGAGVIADKRIEDKAPESFDTVFSTKVDGLDALLSACDPETLRLACAFSSIAGRYGNPGQCDYAMGNEAVTHRLLALPHVRALSVDWGPWDGGMVDPSLKQAFTSRGIGTIDLQAGARAFCDELERQGPVEVVVEGPRPSRGSVALPLSEATHPWLSDHRIAGKPVVPVAVVLDALATLAREVHPGLNVLAIRDLAVLKGITVASPVELTLAWEPAATQEGEAALSMEVRGAPGPLGPTLHYRAVVELTSQQPEAQAFPGSNGLGANAFPHAVDQAYAQWLFHGPTFHAIDEIVGMSDEGMVAWVRTPDADGSGEADPVLLDSAMQMMVLWVRATQGAAALPSYVREFRPFAPLQGRLACHLQVDAASPSRGRFRATLVDEGGTVVATLSECEYTADTALTSAFHGPR